MLNVKTAIALIVSTFICVSGAHAQTIEQINDKFRQLNEYLPTANVYRTASGAPGHEYWQQQADYEITAELNDQQAEELADESGDD